MPYTPTPSYRDVPHLRSNRKFLAAVEKAVRLKAEMAEVQTEYDMVRMEKILPEMVESGVDRVDFNGHQVGVVTRKDTKKLNKQKLIVELEAMGVDISVIDRCSDPVDGYTYVEIRGPREEQLVSETRRAVRTKNAERKLARLGESEAGAPKKAAGGRR